MAVVSDLIRKEENGTLSFGDYTLKTKAKRDNFDYQGNVFKVKTFDEITKLEKNGMFAYESVPGTTVTNFVETNNGASFNVEGAEDAQITLGLDEDKTYKVKINGKEVGDIKTGLGGKLSISVELENQEVC
ncbi:hypothetical protein [Lachnobacterium bovis]|uniref:hypothetical protein n=1 Tax=Lachnobacterium bovis TaxID=140626 RepID=UPI00048D8380|nr:hypothetical protein [Lachnobacterium bovis]